MHILLAHTFYKQAGGEDRVFAAEAALLRANGHVVTEFREYNDRMEGLSQITMGAKAIWNHEEYRRLRGIIRQERPQICHFHNTFPLMSPAVFQAAKSEGTVVVATLHNYRLICPAATLMRDGRICEECETSYVPWHAAQHRCYRGSRGASAVSALVIAAHRFAKTWSRAVDTYIALTEFARQKFVSTGLPAERVVIKPNFVAADPGRSVSRANFALYVGRLSPEKGIATLLEAWRSIALPVRLKIVGDGPMADAVSAAAQEDPRIEWLGTLPREHVTECMKRARVLVFPSIWYEGFPLTILEAFATGLPVVASNLGSMAEIVREDCGVRFEPGDAADLARNVAWCWTHPDRLVQMGRCARQRFQENYTAECNYRRLMEIYDLAIRGVSPAIVPEPAQSGQAPCSYIPGYH